jgi:hypothetical protein
MAVPFFGLATPSFGTEIGTAIFSPMVQQPLGHLRKSCSDSLARYPATGAG